MSKYKYDIAEVNDPSGRRLVRSRTTTAPPAHVVGDVYLIPSAATGEWSTHIGEIAGSDGSAWIYQASPPDGLLLWIEDEGVSLEFTGGAFREVLASPIFAQLSSSVDQIPSDTNPTVITFNTQDGIQGLTHSVSVNSGEITIDTSGLYIFVIQPQIGKDTGGVKIDVDLFTQLDTGSGFVDVVDSSVILTITDADITDVLILTEVMPLNVGDKVRCMQRVSATGSGIGLKSTAAVVGPPSIPATPSVITSIARMARRT